MKLFLDTNVLIDLYQRREPFYRDIRRIQIMEVFGDVELWASAKSFTDIYYVLSKKHESSTIQRAFEASFEFLHICSIDSDDVRQAVQLGWEDFEDCLIDLAARKVKADVLLTRDISGFSESRIPIKRPEAFCGWMEQTYGLVYDDTDW